MNNKPKPKMRQQPQPQEIVDTEFEETKNLPSVVAKGLTAASRSLAVQLQETELQVQLTWAWERPRDVHRAMEAMVRMATMSEDSAADMTYTVPRGGKMIEGPSIRFAEAVKEVWPHSKADAYVLFINREDKYIVARGMFYDFEMNNVNEATVQRSIRDKYGKIFTDDMINQTCNAACSIAKRNAILRGGIPEAAWMNAWQASRKKAVGGLEGFAKKRQEALKYFMQAGVAPDRVLAALGVRSEAALTGDHITSLRGMRSALQNGEATLDDLFPPIKAAIATESEEEHKPKKQSKTLADLAEDSSDVSDAKLRERVDQSFQETQKNVMERVIEEARDNAREAFHKGITSVPVRYRDDPELAKAWIEEYEATQRDAADEIEEDDEDTKGAE